jgi:hypothetical protein
LTRVTRWIAGVGFGLCTSGAAWANACLTTPLAPIDCDGTSRTLDIYTYDPRVLTNYAACATVTEAGPERILPFYCAQTGQVSAVLRNTDCDLDLFVIGAACNPGINCQAADVAATWGNGVHGTVTFTCTAGVTYYLVVEGWALGYTPSTCLPAGSSWRSDFTLQMRCDERCGDGVDNDGDGLADCADGDCTCVEDCALPGDEDGNGLSDCADPACAGAAQCCDADGDGALASRAACGGGDCNDNNAAIGPSRAELAANGVDENCDGVDACWRDADGDGFGSATVVAGDDLDCTNGGPFAGATGDCRDSGAGAAQSYPGAPEVAGDGFDQDCDGVDHCYRDRDLDTYGVSPAQPGPATGCATAGWAVRAGDCRDTGAGAAQVAPGAAERCDGIDNDCDALIDDADPDLQATVLAFPDGDGDGYGAVGAGAQVTGCDFPPGYVPFGGDCDDLDPSRAPGVEERPYDGIDQDCSGADLRDVDGDGYDGVAGLGPDCDDTEPLVHPARLDVANGIDDDCDGQVDEATAHRDDDGDGVAEAGGDCDDADATSFPAAPERCDGVDNDCDGQFDEGTDCFDDDGDGYSEGDGDCDDASASVRPGAVEVNDNGVDDDCNGVTDQAVQVDEDGDGYADFAGDCDDTNPALGPHMAELPNLIDDDCNGRVDDQTDYGDDDGDGWSEVLGDCHDGADDVYPGAVEVIDGWDQDCNGVIDDVGPWADRDGDGWAAEQGDCNDSDAAVAPGAPERPNGADDDCDGVVDERLDDLDGDGFGADDCDDAQGWANPAAVEACDGFDNNCDGAVDEGCPDSAGPASACGCAGSSRAGAGAWWLGIGLLALRRRRAIS